MCLTTFFLKPKSVGSFIPLLIEILIRGSLFVDDVVVFILPDIMELEIVKEILRSFGGHSTETWSATPPCRVAR
jgi:hypothetical protein